MAEEKSLETGITGEQVGTILTIAQLAIPFKDMTFKDADAILKNREGFAADIRRAFSKKRFSKQSDPINIPLDNEVFELTLDGDAMPPEKCSKGMAGWEYKGPNIIGKYTRRFKLVRIGHCKNANEAREKLLLLGGVPNSQWMIPFKAKYGQHDSEGSIGICDPAWELDRCPGTYIPSYFGSSTSIHFSRTDLGKDESWRWLIEVSGGKSHDENA